MKKAKIALSAIAILAVVGGAFAFKASRTPHKFYRTDINGICTSAFLTTYTTDPLVGGPATTLTTINFVSTLAPCKTTIVYPVL